MDRNSADRSHYRTHSVNVRFNQHELQELDMLRQNMSRASYLRAAFFEKAPQPIPEINRRAYVELSKTANEIHQLAMTNSSDPLHNGEDLLNLFHKFRMQLITGLTT